jgi:hypothetical protein
MVLTFEPERTYHCLFDSKFVFREKMVATLLSCGAKPNLVTDPTPQNPGGCTAADLAYMKGYDGLAAYLSEKCLVEQFNDMSLAGNISGSLDTTTNDPVNPENLTEDQMHLKDTLAAYRTTAEAAARIQAAFREHSLKLRYQAVQFISPEEEARQIVAAMKIQHAFRNFETRKAMAAAARIQYKFRSWKLRREFLNMRRQAIKIQVRAALSVSVIVDCTEFFSLNCYYNLHNLEKLVCLYFQCRLHLGDFKCVGITVRFYGQLEFLRK